MPSFDVLNRKTNIHQSRLLEASAGTGKTFSIENMVARLLIEDHPETQEVTTLEQILVVTFTRAAMRDLKIRIRSTLENALSILQGASNNQVPDYLQALLERGEEKTGLAKRRLEQALATFDQAQIFTIHGFCMRMLTTFVFESDFNMNVGNNEERSLKKEEMLHLIRNFFRTEIRHEIYSPAQLQIILSHHGNQIEKVQEALLKLLNKDCDFGATADFSSDLATFNSIMRELKEKHQLNPEKMREDFEIQIEYYKAIKNKDIRQAEGFFNLFHKNEWAPEDFDLLITDGLLLCEFLTPNNVKKNKKLPDFSLHYPHLVKDLQRSLELLVKQARSYEFIFARMSYYCRQLLQKYLAQEDKHRENDLLTHMLNALKNPLFIVKASSLYQTAVIDEFQDTDPVQWEIFQKLFLNKSLKRTSATSRDCRIILVGDPKQSIYAFRQADIYTYLSAAQSLGLEHHASLDTNYRSQPSLVQGLNVLFKACPQMFALPALSQEESLDCPVVKFSNTVQNKLFSDDLGSIHFFCAEVTGKATQKFPSEQSEENFFFLFIAQEILRLHRKDQQKFRQFAVLIKDKFQAQRLAHFFDKFGIPYALQRQVALTESIAWESLKELLLGVLHPKNESSLKIVLGGQILGWNYHQVKALDNEEQLAQILGEFYRLRQKLVNEGFAHFFQHLMNSCWHVDGLTVIEKLLSQNKGDVFYDELHQIAALLIEYQSEHPAGPERLIEFLDENKRMPPEDDERLKKFADPTRDAVSILTIHNSKGLEYDIVFAYGLAGRPKAAEQLIPQKDGLAQRLIPCLDTSSPEYMKHCEELDAEKMRQLYVAMTRAKYRLYVPITINPLAKPIDFGCASPIEIFLARLGKPPCSYQELYNRLGNQQENFHLKEFIHNHPETKFSLSYLNDTDFSLEKNILENKPELVYPKKVHVPGEQCFIQSFTSLSKYKKTSPENNISASPQDFSFAEKNAHTLPAGNHTGRLLHKILEIVPFSALQKIVSPEGLSPWIQPLIQGTKFNAWEETLCRMAHQAFKTPLGEGFCLADVNPSLLYRETEFLYPCERKIMMEDLQWRAGFLKGVIDLVFMHNDRYYLIDWKSNWLGSGLEHYMPENMHAVMQQHDYYFQARIYQEALRRYLKLFDNRPFEEIYGGCFYIFLRGLDGSSNKSTGILRI